MPQQPPKVYHPELGYFPIPVSKSKPPPRICFLGGGFAGLYLIPPEFKHRKISPSF
ncbi:hypothetical protein PCC9214_00794 [Planktothrix tepida]|uniref:Uncharacterized protein n=1 Tax=Planktothrix tepida PCC 9214 TaxID=671072 RepID=A0A1J1LHN5_9CYAN|nr:hypothetical protein PCC9214_00794 [Planktothrix tepida]CUR31089.1 hypothetical protein PL9214290680 [Planktothrix tepida PCC 9214]